MITVKDIKLAGIPCQAEIDVWPAEPMTYEEPGIPAGWELIEVQDRKGYRAKWLEAKLEDPIVEAAFDEAVDLALDKMADDALDDYGDYLYDQMVNRKLEGHL